VIGERNKEVFFFRNLEKKGDAQKKGEDDDTA
jgi:hypothetical protein